MSDFHKRFVRVEWLAFSKVVDLIREAGFDDSYFVGRSELIGDEGKAAIRAEAGIDLYDGEGQFSKHEELHADDFGLEEEIGEFFQKSEKLERDQRFFLKRTYAFHVFEKGMGFSHISIRVAFAKLTEKDDWMLIHECVVDQSHEGDGRWVVYRTKDFAEVSKI